MTFEKVTRDTPFSEMTETELVENREFDIENEITLDTDDELG
jgi:hypothetical protein